MKIFSTLKKQATSFLEQHKQGEPATYAAAEQAIGAVLITDGFIGIDNPLGGKKRPGIFGTVIGAIVGIIFLFIPTIVDNISGMNKMTATTSATVVAVGMNTNTVRGGNSQSSDNACSLTVRYMVDGKEYTKQSSMSSSSNCGLSEGRAITINYNPDNPASWANDVKNIGFAVQVFFWVGVLMIVSSIITFVIRLLSIIFGWKLLKDGRKLAATLPQGTDLQTIINEIKQNFIGKVFNFGGGGAVNMVSSMTNPTAQPPAQPPIQPTPTTQPPTQPTQTQPPVSNETPPPATPPTSEPTNPPEEPQPKP